MRMLISLLLIGSLVLSQTYEAGDIISETHQNQVFDICYGDYPTDDFRLSDLNGALNGGDYYIILLDMATTW